MTKKYQAVELFYNSKRPKYSWKKDPVYVIDFDVGSYYKHNASRSIPKNYSIITGKKSNLSVVDIDCQKSENINDNVFIKKFGNDPTKWAETIGGVVISTPSGGFHIYYQYEESLKQGQDAESNVDIRNDGGLILSAGCVRDGKTYELISGDLNNIQKCPDAVLDLIHSIPYYDPTKKGKNGKTKTKIKKIKDASGKEVIVEEIIGCDQSLYIYDFPDDLLYKVIKGLDKKYFNTYSGYLLFTTAMKQIDRQDIWEEFPKLNNPAGGSVDCEEHKTWMLDCWDNISGHKTILAMNHLLLNTSYENARTALDYYKYKPALKNRRNPHQKINSAKLGYEFFQNVVSGTDKKKFIVVKSDTGTGKTTSFKSFMNSEEGKKCRFVSIVSRISLGLEQYETFMEEGIDCGFYENESFYPGENYICQIDSLMKLKWWCDQGGLVNYVLFLDEFNSMITHLFTSDTLSKNGIRIPLIELLIELIQEAKYVFMTDADISDPALEFLDYALEDKQKDDMIFILNEYKHNQDRPAEEIFDIEMMINMMKKQPKWICACDEARMCHLLKEQIGDDKILIIDSKVNVRYDWDEYDRIIFSPKVIYGLDSVMKRPVFCVYKETTIDPKSMLQQINRNRNITKLYYLFQRKKCRDCDFNSIEDAMEDTDNLKKWCELNDYLHQEISKAHPIFKSIFNQLKYNSDCYMTNPYAHFKQLKTERGFIEETKIAQSCVKKTNELLKIDKERMINLINKDMPFVMKMNEYIGLPEEEIENYKEIFMDRNFIGRFIGLRRYVLDDYESHYDTEQKQWIQQYTSDLERWNTQNQDMKSEIFKKEEFNVNKIKTLQSKMIFLERLREAVESKNRFQLKNVKVMNEDKAKKFYDEYKSTFGDKTTKENPLLSYEGTQQFIGKIYKKMFGINPFPSKSTSKDGKTIRIFDDCKVEDFGLFHEIHIKTKKEYERKQIEKEQKKEKGFLIDNDSDQE